MSVPVFRFEPDGSVPLHGLDGIGAQVFEDEEGQVGVAVVDGRTRPDVGAPCDAGTERRRGSAFADHFGEEFVGGDFIGGESLFIAQDADDIIDHGAHAARGLGCFGRIRVGRHGLLERGEGIAETVDEMGSDGADGGRLGGEGEFAVGIFESGHVLGEQPVGAFEPMKGEGEE